MASCLQPVGNASATYSSYLYANETLRMLDAHDPSKPLYVYHAWNNVHAPNEAPQHYINKHRAIQDPNRRNLAAMVSALDDSLVAIVEKLKAKGMWDNTLLVFSTDNGGNLGGSGINYPLRGGKYTFWQGGVRGLGFVAGGLVPAHLRGTTWDGAVHAADWYTTFAALAGVHADSSGPLPPDGVDISQALLRGQPSPRREVVIQIVSNSSGNDHALPPRAYCEAVEGTDAAQHCHPPTGVAKALPGQAGLSCGVLIQDKWKLLWGYPGWEAQPSWDGWIKPSSVTQKEQTGKGKKPCNLHEPCLFDIRADPTEHHDVAHLHPEVVAKMKRRILTLLKGEVTLAASGLCPRADIGTRPDPRMVALAKKTGFWQPWL